MQHQEASKKRPNSKAKIPVIGHNTRYSPENIQIPPGKTKKVDVTPGRQKKRPKSKAKIPVIGHKVSYSPENIQFRPTNSRKFRLYGAVQGPWGQVPWLLVETVFRFPLTL